MKAHFAPVAELPVPSEWEDRIRRATSAQVIDLAVVRSNRAPAAALRWWRNPWAGMAVAASLALGVFVGMQAGQGGPIALSNGALVASGDLGKALDTQLASAQDGAAIRMLGTFQKQDGAVCRAFAGAQASGIACRDGGQWHLQHVLPGSRADTAGYRQAGSADGELMAIAQGMAKGDPFDAAQERAARAKGWRP